MAIQAAAPQQNGQSKPERARRKFPPFSLQETLVVAKAIAENNAGKPYSRLSLAESIGRKPDSSAYRDLLSSSISYGLTEGSMKAPLIKLTSLGVAITMPSTESEAYKALVKAARGIPIYNELYTKFDQNKLPSDTLFRNTLIREHGIDPAHADECVRLFRADGKFTGLIRAVAGTDRVDLLQEQLGVGVEEEQADDELPEEGFLGSGQGALLPLRAPVTPDTNSQQQPEAPKNAIFIGHGKDRAAVDQLKELLSQMGLKSVVAQDEPHAGRPISQKVADCMRECGAGIFVVSGDDNATDTDGNTTKRARQNVIYELGAASFLYGQRIVIFKEAGVEFPSDFSDLGYIEYEKGHLSDKFAELIRELVKLRAVVIQAGGN